MRHPFTNLTLDERRAIARMLQAKVPVPEIADRLLRLPSTIYRDLKRSTYQDAELPQYSGYYAVTAQDICFRVLSKCF